MLLYFFTNGQRIKLTILRYTIRFSEKACSEKANCNRILESILRALQIFRATACAGEDLKIEKDASTHPDQCRHIFWWKISNFPPSQTEASGVQVARLDSSNAVAWAPEMLAYNVEAVPCFILLDCKGNYCGNESLSTFLRLIYPRRHHRRLLIIYFLSHRPCSRQIRSAP